MVDVVDVLRSCAVLVDPVSVGGEVPILALAALVGVAYIAGTRAALGASGDG